MPDEKRDQKSAAAERLFRKEKATTDGAKAMAEYTAAAEAKSKNMGRLREQRLIREAADNEAKVKAGSQEKGCYFTPKLEQEKSNPEEVRKRIAKLPVCTERGSLMLTLSASVSGQVDTRSTTCRCSRLPENKHSDRCSAAYIDAGMIQISRA